MPTQGARCCWRSNAGAARSLRRCQLPPHSARLPVCVKLRRGNSTGFNIKSLDAKEGIKLKSWDIGGETSARASESRPQYLNQTIKQNSCCHVCPQARSRFAHTGKVTSRTRMLWWGNKFDCLLCVGGLQPPPGA